MPNVAATREPKTSPVASDTKPRLRSDPLSPPEIHEHQEAGTGRGKMFQRMPTHN